jgi:hypothetical protein
MKPHIHIDNLPWAVTLFVVVASLSSCGKTFLQMTGGEKTGSANFELDKDSIFNNIKDRCGASLEQLTDPNSSLVNFTLQSLPIVIESKQNDLLINVKAQATVKIESKGGQAYTDIALTILDITGQSTDGKTQLSKNAIATHIRGQAETEVMKNTGRSRGIAAPSTSALKNYKSDGQYKGIFCAVGFSAGTRDELGEELGEIDFEEIIPMSPNPMAALSTFEQELGDSKTFKTNVRIKTAKADWVKDRETVPVTVTFKKINPDITKFDGLPPNTTVPPIKANIAYEVLVSGPEGITVASFGMQKRAAYFVNTDERKLSAVVNISDKIDPKTKKTSPPIVLLPTN